MLVIVLMIVGDFRGRGVYVGDCVCGREEMRQASYGHCQPLGADSYYVTCYTKPLIWSMRLKSL